MCVCVCVCVCVCYFPFRVIFVCLQSGSVGLCEWVESFYALCTMLGVYPLSVCVCVCVCACVCVCVCVCVSLCVWVSQAWNWCVDGWQLSDVTSVWWRVSKRSGDKDCQAGLEREWKCVCVCVCVCVWYSYQAGCHSVCAAQPPSISLSLCLVPSLCFSHFGLFIEVY